MDVKNQFTEKDKLFIAKQIKNITIGDVEEEMNKLHSLAQVMLDEWAVTKVPPKHAAWLHQKEFKE